MPSEEIYPFVTGFRVRFRARNSEDVTGYAMTEQTTESTMPPMANGHTMYQLS